MLKKKKVIGAIITAMGFILSPLSWWNDLLVNIPIAYFFASLVASVNKSWFTVALVVFYWLTNLLGFILMHLGVLQWKGVNEKTVGEVIRENFPMTFLYSLLMIILIKIGWVKLPWEYLK